MKRAALVCVSVLFLTPSLALAQGLTDAGKKRAEAFVNLLLKVKQAENGPLSKFSARSHGFGVLRVARKRLDIECRDTSGKLLHTQTRVAA